MVENAKMKDALPPEPFAFKFETVELGFDHEDGTPATSAILAPCDPPALSRNAATGKHQQKALAVLQDLHQEHRQRLEQSGRDPDQAHVSITDWRDASKDTGIPRNRWYEARTALIEKGAVIHEPPHCRPA